MGWAHLGFWASLAIFGYMIWYVLRVDSLRRAASKHDDKSRLEYARNPRVWEDGQFVLSMIALFFVVCLFGHLAGSPLSDTWNSYVEWADSFGEWADSYQRGG